MSATSFFEVRTFRDSDPRCNENSEFLECPKCKLTKEIIFVAKEEHLDAARRDYICPYCVKDLDNYDIELMKNKILFVYNMIHAYKKENTEQSREIVKGLDKTYDKLIIELFQNDHFIQMHKQALDKKSKDS